MQPRGSCMTRSVVLRHRRHVRCQRINSSDTMQRLMRNQRVTPSLASLLLISAGAVVASCSGGNGDPSMTGTAGTGTTGAAGQGGAVGGGSGTGGGLSGGGQSGAGTAGNGAGTAGTS